MSGILQFSGRVSDLAGGLKVRRVLPAAVCRSVGPFVFFDHFGPVELSAASDSDIGPHPHIGLATVSYLFEGHLLHRDSLGNVQTTSPGAINWMTAGRGIVHSERSIDAERGQTRRLHGLQLWVALPPDQEQCEPSFQHVPASAIPEQLQIGGVKIRLLVGQAFGLCSPVKTASTTLYLDITLPADTCWQLPPLAPQMAIYSPEHDIEINGENVAAQQMAILPPDVVNQIRSAGNALHFVIIGGGPLQQPIRMWWNFVSSNPQRVADAAQGWENGDFPVIPGDGPGIAAPKWPAQR